MSFFLNIALIRDGNESLTSLGIFARRRKGNTERERERKRLRKRKETTEKNVHIFFEEKKRQKRQKKKIEEIEEIEH